MPSAESTGSSTSAFVSALILYGIIGIVFFLIFAILRPKQARVYQPKTLELPTLRKDSRPPEVSSGFFAWISELWVRPQQFFLQYIGLDGYLFVRYIGIFATISLVSAIVLLPILLPVNATNGQNLQGFELLGFANVTNNKRYYAHVFLSWFFFGFIVWIIYKELVFYVSLRHSVQTTPLYDGLLSSRTILITDLPDELQSEDDLKRVFPLVSRSWFARDNTELSKLVKERTKLTKKYEAALNTVVKKSVKYHAKLIKKGEKIPEDPSKLIQKQPTHRLGKIPLIGKKVETIDYSLKTLPELNAKIEEFQSTPETAKQVGSVFLEFPNQLEAQKAFQSLPYQKQFKGEYFIGVSPDDVIWDNLSLTRSKRYSKKILANTFLTLLIIFWAIPVAVVGFISNITFLTSKLKFLKFINNAPKVILGLITGILPTVALAILMSLVPVIIKAIGKLSGLPTKQAIDQYTQSWYYGFLIVQVFLVVTLASSASSTVTAIIDDPSSAMTLLAQNLPKASNFYIAYFLLQGIYTPAWTILRAVPLALSKALAFLLNTPRKKWTKENVLAEPAFGVLYPNVELLNVLFVVYAIIAPVLLVFSTFALGLAYLVQLYLYTYVQGRGLDSRGRNYPKALFQSFVGIYLAEICVLGLFIMAKTWGPVALEAVVLIVTVLAHLYFKRRFVPLFDIVPISGIHESRGDGLGTYPKDQGVKEIKQVGEDYKNGDSTSIPTTVNGKSISGDDDAATYQFTNKDNKEAALLNDSNSSRNETILGNSNNQQPITQEKINTETDISKLEQQAKSSPLKFIKKFISPTDGYNFTLLRSRLPPNYNLTTNYQPDYLEIAYTDPNIRDEEPKIWIPRDNNGVSGYEVGLAYEKVVVSDANATLTKEDGLTVSGPPPDFSNDVKV